VQGSLGGAEGQRPGSISPVDPSAARPPLAILNPRASRLADPKRRMAVRHDIELAVRARFGCDPEWAPETHDGARAALHDTAGRPIVVVAGGDGTIREAAEALAGGPVPLGIVPAGTGNVLAGTLRLGGIRAALRALRDGTPRRLDLGIARWEEGGTVHERTFTVACGLGFDARIMAAAEHEWKRRIRFGAYVGAALREVVRLQPARFRITADDRQIAITGLVVLVANCGDLIPGRLGAREPLDPTDGSLDLIVVGGSDVVAGLRGAADLLLRTGELDGSSIRRPVRRVRVEADPAQPIQVDGDVHPAGWLEATVMPGALDVLVAPD
jgi:diacylglycerol kinase (ATP)